MNNMLPLSTELFVEHEGEFWLEARVIASILGYSHTDAVLQLYQRHKDELIEYSVVIKLTTTDGKAYKKRVFKEEGLYLMSMLGRTAKARTFCRNSIKFLSSQKKPNKFMINSML